MTTAAEARTNWTARKQRRAQAKRYRARQMVWAKRAYVELIDELGGTCFNCGATWQEAPLSVHHGKGRTWEARAVRFDLRVKRYLKERAAGEELLVACMSCNSRDANNHRGKNRRY